MTASTSYTLPKLDTREAYLRGFWGWVEIMAAGDYELAARSLDYGGRGGFTGETLKRRVEYFFGDEHHLTVAVPNERLVGVINDAAEVQMPDGGRRGWIMAQIPLTNEPERAKEDDVMLMGAAISLFVVEKGDAYGFEFEIFHA